MPQAPSKRCFSRMLLLKKAIQRQGLAIDLMSATRINEYSLLLQCGQSSFTYMPREHTRFWRLILDGECAHPEVSPEHRKEAIKKASGPSWYAAAANVSIKENPNLDRL